MGVWGGQELQVSKEDWFLPAGIKSRSRNPRPRWWLLVPMVLPQPQVGNISGQM